MGACLSCLGLDGKGSHASENSDTSGLLGGEPHQFHYGTFTGAGHDRPQDPDAIQRERDALERLCAYTTARMIDVSVPPTRASDVAEVDTADIIGADTLALLADAFKSTGNATGEPTRPRFNEAKDEGEWLKKVLASRNIRSGEPMPWDVVIPIEGSLTMNFEDSLGEPHYTPSPVIGQASSTSLAVS